MAKDPQGAKPAPKKPSKKPVAAKAAGASSRARKVVKVPVTDNF